MTTIVPETVTLHRIASFSMRGDYLLQVRFDDDAERVIDFEPILVGPMFGPLRDAEMFSQVELDPDFGALVWPNGADIDPMVVYNWPAHLEQMIERRREML